MKRILVFLAAACVLLSLVACGYQESLDEAYQSGYNKGYEDGYDSGRDRGYEEGYDEAESEYTTKIEDIQFVLNEAAEMASHLSSMIEEFEYYTVDEVFTAAEELRIYLWDNR